MEIREQLDVFLEKNKNFGKDLKNRVIKYENFELPIQTAFLLYMTLNREQAQLGLANSGFSFEDAKGTSNSITYHQETAAAYLAGIRQMSEDFQIENRVDAGILSRFPEVFTMEEPDMDENALELLITEAMNTAGSKFIESREIEGRKLKENLIEKLDSIQRIVEAIAVRSPDIIKEYRARIEEKVSELLGDTKLEENIIAAELVVFADKICVDEEMVRLKTHIVHMKETLESGEAIGRKLDFLTQEMNREANTILSKANDIQVANYGIELKTEIEKIREQIQNIE